MRIAVFGAAGMLGEAVVEAIAARGHEAIAITRQRCDISDYHDVLLALKIERPDRAINCAGATPDRAPHEMVLANAAGPHLLAYHCGSMGIPLIHISTDCVFDGDAPIGARWSIDDQPQPRTIYGLTKYVGEQAAGAVVVRTSFIGYRGGLLAWLLAQAASGIGEVVGWERAYWTGSTVWAVARALAQLAAATDPAGHGRLVHLASREILSKHALLLIVRDALGLPLHVAPAADPKINRALDPTLALEGLSDCLPEIIARRPR